MKYYYLTSLDYLEVVSWEIPPNSTKCEKCGRSFFSGGSGLTAKWVERPDVERDVVALFGFSEIFLSQRFLKAIPVENKEDVQIEPITIINEHETQFFRAQFDFSVQCGNESIGNISGKCTVCGSAFIIYVGNYLFLKSSKKPIPPIAPLEEAPGIVVISNEFFETLKSKGVQLSLGSVLFEGEKLPCRSDFENNWSDVF